MSPSEGEPQHVSPLEDTVRVLAEYTASTPEEQVLVAAARLVHVAGKLQERAPPTGVLFVDLKAEQGITTALLGEFSRSKKAILPVIEDTEVALVTRAREL